MGYGYGDGYGLALFLLALLFALYAGALIIFFQKLLVPGKVVMSQRIAIALANLLPLGLFAVEWHTDAVEMLTPALLLAHLLAMPVMLYFLKLDRSPKNNTTS